MALYDRIGKTYDTTRRADPSIVARLMKHLQPLPEGRYLDVACGTGNYTLALRSEGVNLEGLDVSHQMLNTLRRKAPDLPLHQGVVEELPFNNNAFDGAVCTLAIHHFDDLEEAFSQVYRVLKQGRLVIFSADQDQMKKYWLNEYFPKALGDSIVQMPKLDNVRDALRKAGFKKIVTDLYDVPPNLQDLFLYCGKHRPQIYFNEQIRAGISTFSSLADPREVEAGLHKLSKDIESGQIQKVMDAYQHNGGDYLFVIAHKGE